MNLRNPWGILSYDDYLDTGSRGPLNPNCMLQTTKTEPLFKCSKNLKNTLFQLKFVTKWDKNKTIRLLGYKV
jgi:hypothetical protein